MRSIFSCRHKLARRHTIDASNPGDECIITDRTPLLSSVCFSHPSQGTTAMDSNRPVSRLAAMSAMTVSAPPGPPVSMQCRIRGFMSSLCSTSVEDDAHTLGSIREGPDRHAHVALLLRQICNGTIG